MRAYTIAAARAELAALRPTLEEIVRVRADTAELSVSVRDGVASHLGGLPELKAAEARLSELLSAVAATGARVKGVAPLLLDFPAELDGESVLLCWLEGDAELAWYHRADLAGPARPT